MFFLKLAFSDQGYLYAHCLFYVVAIDPKCLLYQFFSRGKRTHIPILTGVQNGHISLLKDCVFLQKSVLFEASFH